MAACTDGYDCTLARATADRSIPNMRAMAAKEDPCSAKATLISPHRTVGFLWSNVINMRHILSAEHIRFKPYMDLSELFYVYG